MSAPDPFGAGSGRLAAAVSASGIGLFELDLRSGRLDWSAQTRAIFGIGPDEPIDRGTLSALAHPDDLERMRGVVREAADPAGDGRFEAEFRIVRPDGAVRWLETRGQAWFEQRPDGARSAACLIGTVLDVTDRREAERRLDEEHAWLSLALEAGRMGLWEWNFTTGERRWSAAMYALYGVDPERVTRIAPPHVEEVIAEDRERLQQEIRALRAAGGTAQVEFRVRRRDDGEVRWISSRGTMRRDDGVERMLGVSYDVTERRAAVQQLIDADRRKDEFLAMLAHELRNPLAPLTNAHRLLAQSAALGAPERDLLAMAERQTAQLRRLVDDLLEVERITRGKIVLRLAPVTIDTIVQAAVESMAGAVAQRGHRLRVELPTACAPLRADAARLTQVVGNLLHNACKYTPEGGSIRVEAHELPDQVTLRVVDDGIGLEPERLEQVFELFSQVDATLDRAQGGLGIGLALVRQLVGLHGGSVRADSAGRGQGTTFTVRLPRGGPPGEG